jgi:serine/threonine protein kinase
MENFPLSLGEGSILAGQYTVGRVLGQGGFGITYLALDRQLDIKVAIKEFLPEGMAVRMNGNPELTLYTGDKQENFIYGMEQFLDEARALAKFIGNPNIAAVRSYFSENNTAYFVMEYIEGTSFKNHIKNSGGRIDYAEALRVLVPVMDALSAVHNAGLIHRDVTPDNIYMTRDGGIKAARLRLGKIQHRR